ncbi:hypothetical protein E2C01_026663 [Portunus trituberculatus]|uniref:Uncharacterized protein n=1 Tax=Portunus trituberculatus TaxID=210409 RepID=A0A5B7EJI4_PORTR|nr:hypothetical protein [Portunus trituberculatus]
MWLPFSLRRVADSSRHQQHKVSSMGYPGHASNDCRHCVAEEAPKTASKENHQDHSLARSLQREARNQRSKADGDYGDDKHLPCSLRPQGATHHTAKCSPHEGKDVASQGR